MPELDAGYYASPRWSWEILDCAMPMTFDTYSNCAHQCVYCFAYFQRAINSEASEAYLAHRVRSVDVERVKRMFTDPDKYAGQFAFYIKKRMVLQWGGLSDGFDWYERKFRKSLELLRFFREIDYPISISTKGTWWVDDPDYIAAVRDAKNMHFKYSIITTSKEHASKLEAGTPPPIERFKALRKLADLGVGCTTLRFRPFILGISDLCIEDMMKHGGEAGCYSVTTEFLCLESRASHHAKERYDRISKVCGFDVYEMYRTKSFTRAGLLRLNYDLKRPYIDRMRKAAETYGLAFFVSDAHHKEASVGTGCCGLPDTGPLSNINRGQYSEAMQIAKREGIVRWSDIAPFAEDFKGIPWITAEGYNTGGTRNRMMRQYQNMYDFMRDVWNNPKSVMSPARYFGGALVPMRERDADGDLVYLYNRPFIEDNQRVNSVAELEQMMGVYQARGEALREDGSTFGHVAFPIYVTVDPQKPLNAPHLLDNARLLYKLVTPADHALSLATQFPQSEVLANTNGNTLDEFAHADAEAEGLSYYWRIDGALDGFMHGDLPQATDARSFLSELEARFDTGATDLELPGVALVEITPEKQEEM